MLDAVAIAVSRRGHGHPSGDHGAYRGRGPGVLVRRVPAVHGAAIGIDFAAGPLARPGQPGRAAGHRVDDLLLAVLRRDRHVLPRAHAHVPGGNDRVLPDRRHLRPVRLVRADERVGVRADRVPARGARPGPGRAELRDQQQRRRVPVAVRHRDRLRADRGAEHGPDRQGPGRPPAGRAGHRGLRADHRRAAGQGLDRAVPLLAGRRARGRAHPGVRAVLRRDGGTRAVRGGPGVLVDIRGRARPRRSRSPARSWRSGCSPR